MCIQIWGSSVRFGRIGLWGRVCSYLGKAGTRTHTHTHTQREEEGPELEALLRGACAYDVAGGVDNKANKANVLIQVCIYIYLAGKTHHSL